MRFLGIDFGMKKIGLSVSDEGGQMAFPLSVLPNTEKIFDEIEKVVVEKNIEAIVMGESKNFAGQPNEIMVEIEKFKSALEQKLKIKVIFEPEFLTSVQARQIMGKNEMEDASAATIILQSYLDKNQAMI